MKKVLISVLLLMCVSLFAQETIKPTDPTAAESAVDEETSLSYRVQLLEGSATIENAKFGKRALKYLQKVNVGDSVRVISGKVSLVAEDGTLLKLVAGTSIKFDEFSINPKNQQPVHKVQLQEGKVYSKIAKLSKNSDFTLVTPTIVAGVRGTHFSIDLSDGNSRLFVTEGKVALGTSADKLDMLVGAGETGFIEKGGALAKRQMNKSELQNLAKDFEEDLSKAISATEPAKAKKTEDKVASESAPEGEVLADKSPDTKKEKKSGGLPFTGGFGVGLETIDGVSFTRIAFSPEFKIKKLGIGLDLELFLGENGRVISKGWDFSTLDAGVDSVLRKIRYVSYNTKNAVVYGEDHFFLKMGSLDSVTLGTGFIMKGFANSLMYPIKKPLGAEIAFNVQGSSGFGLEAVAPDVSDIARGGGVYGGRLFLSPLRKSKGVLSKLQVGATFVGDMNQYAGLLDSDGDDVPDELDSDPYDSKVSTLQQYEEREQRKAGRDDVADAIKNSTNYDNNTFTLSKNKDSFAIGGLDLTIPIVKPLRLFAQVATPIDDKDDSKAEGIGFSGGALLLFNLFNASIEYRRLQGGFRASYFGYQYDNIRATFSQGVPLTADNALWGTDENVNAIYGSMMFQIPKVINFGLEYEQKISSSDPMDKTLMGSISLDKALLDSIPLLGTAKAFYQNVGFGKPADLYTGHPFLTYGYEAGIDLGGATLIYRSLTTFEKSATSSKYEPVSVMSIGTEVSF